MDKYGLMLQYANTITQTNALKKATHRIYYLLCISDLTKIFL